MIHLVWRFYGTRARKQVKWQHGMSASGKSPFQETKCVLEFYFIFLNCCFRTFHCDTWNISWQQWRVSGSARAASPGCVFTHTAKKCHLWLNSVRVCDWMLASQSLRCDWITSGFCKFRLDFHHMLQVTHFTSFSQVAELSRVSHQHEVQKKKSCRESLFQVWVTITSVLNVSSAA